MTDSCEITFSVGEWLKTVEMNKFVVHGTFLQIKITPIVCLKKNTFSTRIIGGALSISRKWRPTIEKTVWFQTYIKTFTPRSCRRPTRAHSLLEVQTMETSIEFFLHLVAMARILVVFLRIHRMSRRRRQANVCDRTGQPVVYRTLANTSDEWLSRIQSILSQLDRLQLTAVYCNPREV